MAAITRLHLHHHHHHAFPIIKPSLLLSKLSHSPSFFPNFHSTPLRKFSLTPLLCSISDRPLQVPYLILSFHTLVIFSLVPVKARKIEDSWRKFWTFSFLLVISQNRKKIKKKMQKQINSALRISGVFSFIVLETVENPIFWLLVCFVFLHFLLNQTGNILTFWDYASHFWWIENQRRHRIEKEWIFCFPRNEAR